MNFSYERASTLESGVGLLVLMALWCALTYSGIVPPFFLATPTEVARAFARLIFEAAFWNNVAASVWRIGAGFALSVVVAVPLGALLCVSSRADRVLVPPISFIRYLPVPALVPFLILWFGVDEGEKIAVVFVGVFFQLILIVADDLRSLPDEIRDIALSLGASEWKILTTVTFPNALPALYDAARITLAWAWGWVMVAELVGSNSGLGHMIITAQRFLINADMIVGLLTIGVLGLAADTLMRYARPQLFRWTA